MTQLKGHQGDVQFRTVANVPSTAKKVANKPIALGEHSGHMHILTGEVDMYENTNGDMFAVVGKKGARLQHIHESRLVAKEQWEKTEEIEKADHESHLLPEGTYEFWIQNAYNPYAKVMEKVID